MQAYISTFFCREYNIPCQKKVQQNQIKNIIFLRWYALHSTYWHSAILQAQTIRTVVLALLVPLVHSQDNTCLDVGGMLRIPPTGTQQSCAAFSRFAFLIFAKQSASALSANIRKATLRVSQDCFVGAGGRTRTDTEG